MPKRPCKQYRCPALTDDGYCDAHRQELKRETNRFRGSAASRGYDYQHRKLREEVFREQKYLCTHCLEKGRITLCTELHHKLKVEMHPHLRLVRSNVEGLCRDCHEEAEKKAE